MVKRIHKKCKSHLIPTPPPPHPPPSMCVLFRLYVSQCSAPQLHTTSCLCGAHKMSIRMDIFLLLPSLLFWEGSFCGECQVVVDAPVVEYAENAAGGVVRWIGLGPCVYVDYNTCTCRETDII